MPTKPPLPTTTTTTAIKWTKNLTPKIITTLINSEQNIDKAISIFHSATTTTTTTTPDNQTGFRHTPETYTLMIKKLVSANRFKPAENLLIQMKTENISISPNIILNICRGYGRAHKPLEAYRLFKAYEGQHLLLQDLEKQKSCVEMFNILVDENELDLALKFYNYVRREVGVGLSVVMLNVLVKLLCKNSGTVGSALEVFKEMPRRGYAPDGVTYGTVISGLCRFGRVREAVEVFERMKNVSGSGDGILPSVVTYSTLISGFCKEGSVDEAVRLWEEMKGRGVRPNVFSYSSLIDGLCKGGRCKEAVEMMEEMVRERVSPNMVTYSSLISGLCKEGSVRRALEVFDRMKLQGLKPDAGLYGKIICGLCEKCRFREAANFVDEMALAGIKPSRLTWGIHVKTHNNVVLGLCESDLSRAFHLYFSMRTRGLTVEPEVFVALVLGLCKKGEFDKGCRVVEEMICDGCVPGEDIWRALLGGFCEQDNVCGSVEVVRAQLLQNADGV